MKKRLLVTGSTGQLGMELQNLAPLYPQYDWIFLNRKTLDLEKLDDISAVFKDLQPNYCINTAAYTAVVKAESQKTLANIINYQAVKKIAQSCKEINCKLIHFSTDYVFNGISKIPLTEESPPDPINTYGYTKYKGEKACLLINSIIIRTSWVYSAYGHNFVKTMQNLFKTKEKIQVVNDQIGSPTYAGDLANAVIQIINYNIWKSGIYHYANQGQLSWYDFALTIKELLNASCYIEPVSSSKFATIAKRPYYSLLDTKKIIQTYKLSIPYYKDSLKRCLLNIQIL